MSSGITPGKKRVMIPFFCIGCFLSALIDFAWNSVLFSNFWTVPGDPGYCILAQANSAMEVVIDS